jgi:hypothetical protein
VIEAREKWEKKKVQDAKWAKEDKVKPTRLYLLPAVSNKRGTEIMFDGMSVND